MTGGNGWALRSALFGGKSVGVEFVSPQRLDYIKNKAPYLILTTLSHLDSLEMDGFVTRRSGRNQAKVPAPIPAADGIMSDVAPAVVNPHTDRITLNSFQSVADEAVFAVILARIPQEDRVEVGGILYVRHDPYRSAESRNSAWYNGPPHSEEVIRTTKGTAANGIELRGRQYWKCRHCNHYCVGKTTNNDNKLAHLQRAHRITANGNKIPREPLPFREQGAPVSIRANEAYVSIAHKFLENDFQKAVVAFVVICQLSLSLMVNDLFVELLKVIYPTIGKLLPLATGTIRTWVLNSFNLRKQRLKQDMARSLSRIHFSFDLWSSTNHLALLGIIAHYIDHNGVNQTVQIALSSVLRCLS